MNNVDKLRELYKTVEDIENPYDVFNNNQAYMGFNVAIKCVKQILVDETIKIMAESEEDKNV